jgi:hypothetical protein
MSWDDDRRASSFVSSRDPSAVLFARYVAGIVESRPPAPNSSPAQAAKNIRYALGLFEALNALGINYIIDPASSYAELSESSSALDSLNYPYQTLYYRGGDCDDLSILFCSLLETLRIDTAFITIPGHIYMAFDSGLSQEEAKTFPFAADLIPWAGRFWAPVEITLPQAGFRAAWKTGAAEWKNAGSEAKIYPLKEAWAVYPPVSVNVSDVRMTSLVDEDILIAVFEKGLRALR